MLKVIYYQNNSSNHLNDVPAYDTNHCPDVRPSHFTDSQYNNHTEQSHGVRT